MVDLVIVLIPILIVDMINPVLLAGTIFTLGSAHPNRSTLLLLFSYFLSYFFSGVVIAVGLELITDAFEVPLFFDYLLEGVVALLLFYFAWKLSKQGDPHLETKLHLGKPVSGGEALSLGFMINLIGLPFAIPYLAAIDQILKAGISVYSTLVLLLLYNVFYILPYAGLMIVKKLYGEKSRSMFIVLNRKMHYIFARWLPWLFLVLGLVLLEDLISYFLGYREYSLLRVQPFRAQICLFSIN